MMVVLNEAENQNQRWLYRFGHKFGEFILLPKLVAKNNTFVRKTRMSVEKDVLKQYKII